MCGYVRFFGMLTAVSESARWGLWSEVQLHLVGSPLAVVDEKPREKGWNRDPARFCSSFSLHVEATEATNAVLKSAKQGQQNKV